MDPKMNSEKTLKLIILGPILGVLKWVKFRTSKTVRLSPKNTQMVVFEDRRWTRQKIRAPKNGPKNGPQFRYKHILKTLVFFDKN